MPLQHSQSISSKQITRRNLNYLIEDIKVTCLCSHHYQEMVYTNSLVINIQEFGLSSKNIQIINDYSPDEHFSEALETAFKLIIVIPEKINDSHFNKQVEKAVRLFKENPTSDILPILRSKEVSPPVCLSNMQIFSSLEPELKDVLMQRSDTEKIDKFVSSFRNIFNNVLVDKSLEEIIISKNARALLTQFGFEVLKGWGLDVENDRVSFRMKTLQNLSHYNHICLHDVVACLFRGKSFRFLRLYDVDYFDLRDLKLHSNMYNELIQIFKLIIDMKAKRFWYHYRRNGFRHEGSSEEAFKLVKQVFLDKKPSVMFHQFLTYESRLATFQTYPIKIKEFRKRLAEAGFFYFDVSDYVQCYHCGGCLRAWKSLEDPMVSHRTNFKTCPFVLKSKRTKRSEMDIKYKINESLYTPEDRRNSFELFPVTLSEDDLQRLIKAGFYYCGIAEDIVCCECNIGFAGVQNVVNILRLHEIYSQDCLNIRNLSKRKDADDQECISNFVPYLELECREHDRVNVII